MHMHRHRHRHGHMPQTHSSRRPIVLIPIVLIAVVPIVVLVPFALMRNIQEPAPSCVVGRDMTVLVRLVPSLEDAPLPAILPISLHFVRIRFNLCAIRVRHFTRPYLTVWHVFRRKPNQQRPVVCQCQGNATFLRMLCSLGIEQLHHSHPT